jgi:hypothetical protein
MRTKRGRPTGGREKAIKATVLFRLGVDPRTGAIDVAASFMIIADRPDCRGIYDDEPEVIRAIPGRRARRAVRCRMDEETGDTIFGKRVADA